MESPNLKLKKNVIAIKILVSILFFSISSTILCFFYFVTLKISQFKIRKVWCDEKENSGFFFFSFYTSCSWWKLEISQFKFGKSLMWRRRKMWSVERSWQEVSRIFSAKLYSKFSQHFHAMHGCQATRTNPKGNDG